MTKEKRLSAGIQKFLEQKQREDEQKADEARQRKLDLVARRDPKVQRKIEKTLKTLKSSRKFHTADRTLDENAELTLQNLQPDEDDYGYTSNISDQFHKKLMEKYKNLPEEKKFSSGTGKHKAMSKEEIQKTKDRVKNALTLPDEDNHHFRQGPQQRTSKLKRESTKMLPPAPVEKKLDKPKPKLRPAPIVDFQQLLKLAEQKQHEEITIDVPTKKEPERLLTSKEKREQEEMEAQKRARMKPNRIPKLGAIPKIGESSKQDKNNNESSARKSAATGKPSSSTQRPEQKIPDRLKKPAPSNFKTPQSNGSSASSKLRDALQKNGAITSRPSSSSSSINHKVPSSSSSKPGSSSSNPRPRELPAKSISNGKPSSASAASSNKPRPSTSSREPERPRDFPPKDLMRSREFPPKDLMRGREFPPKDLMRSREFPPRDLKRPRPQQQLQVNNKRELISVVFSTMISQFSVIFIQGRIEDEDSEYDSELDDFIDDGEEDLDYSSEIKKIFGYDKSR